MVLAYSEGMSHAEISDSTATLLQKIDGVRLVADAVPVYTEWVISPWGWAGSMLIGAWVVLHTRRSRR